MELIDKAAVVASLTERLKSLQKEYNELVQDEFWETARDVAPKINEIQKTISLISNFRRKEMDSVKEMIDYKQKYEEALSRAKYLKENTDSIGALDVSACFEKIFPELAKSEDELIREEIIDCFVGMKKQGCFPSKHKEQYDSWISWLEKQGKQEQLYIRFGEIPTDEISKIYRGEIEVGTENGVSVYPAFKTDEGDIVLGLSLPITKTTLYTQQQLIEYSDRPCYLVRGDYVGKDTDGQPLINNVSVIEKIDNYRVKEEKQGKQKPADKIEPKFKIEKDKWYICIRELYDAYNNRIFTKGNIYHSTKDETLMSDNSNVPYEIKYCPDHYFCLWTIQNAKDGDVLIDKSGSKECPFIFKETKPSDIKTDILNPLAVLGYCGIGGAGFTKGSGWGDTANCIYYPATKEQRNLLFQKIREAGYEWNSDKKELIRHGQ